MRTMLVFSIIAIACPGAFGAALDAIADVHNRTSYRASSYDRTGGNTDNVAGFAPGETHVMLDTDGPGQVTHMWMTVARFPGHEYLLRDVVIRMYWENASVPSVEVPLGDFFGLAHGKMYAYESVPLAVGAHPVAMNCYWPMPFYKHARIELYNAGTHSLRRVYYNIDYELGDIPAGRGLFHALYRRERELPGQVCETNTTGAENYVILETKGRGQYMGCTLAVDAQPGGWWGEGDEMIYIDGDEMPTMVGTGSEDYFGNAWGYRDEFSYPFYGAPLLENKPEGGKLACVYRWHVPDPIRFKSQIKVTIEHCWEEGIFNDYTSVAYWYQTRPITERPPLPPTEENQPDMGMKVTTVAATQLESDLLLRGIEARAITVDPGVSTAGGWLRIVTGGDPVELRVPVPRKGTYIVQAKPYNQMVEDSIQMSLKGGEVKSLEKIVPEKKKADGENAATESGAAKDDAGDDNARATTTVAADGQDDVEQDEPQVSQADVPWIELGTATSDNGVITVIVSGGDIIGMDGFKLIQNRPAAMRTQPAEDKDEASKPRGPEQ